MGQFALVLATTRVVGMECPGLHSLFNSLRLRFDHESMTASTLVYKVTKALKRYARLTLDVSSKGMTGELQTSFRPRPQGQESLDQIRERVGPDEFRSQRALVIGGSRGLGEVVAKVVSAGGGSVRLSYNLGRQDAERVAWELGNETRAVRLDVTNATDTEIAAVNNGFDATHVYYFGSPRISFDQSPNFNDVQFAEYSRFYVTGLVRLVRVLRSRDGAKMKVFFPSTSFIDAPVPGALEYIAAKAAGEAACRALALEPNAEFLVHRLPQLTTDQTMNILEVQGTDPVPLMLEVVQAMNVIQAHCP
jgi:hypothetical protein